MSKIALYKGSNEDAHTDMITILRWIRLEVLPNQKHSIAGQFVSISKDKSMRMWDTRHQNKPLFSDKFKDLQIKDLVVNKFDSSGPQQTSLIAAVSNKKDEIVFFEFTRKSFKCVKRFRCSVKKCQFLSMNEQTS